ncbi:MAG: response regulator [Desulfobulbaceae bacterium]|nr:response regulator [Desulfobulbaceae bacterium]
MVEAEKLKLLYVDDEEINLYNFTLTFEDDFEVITAISAAEALDCFNHYDEIAIVVADQRMGKMTGVELLEKIHEMAPDTVRVILTAYVVSEDIIDAINRGRVYKYILKPWDADELRLTLEQAREKYTLKHHNKQLLRELAEANAALELSRHELERRVSERTAELAAVNGALSKEIEERRQIEAEREELIADLKEALGRVKMLSGMLPICASCKKIRDDRGYWNHIESYIESNSSALFSHGICPDCAHRLYPDLFQLADG